MKRLNRPSPALVLAGIAVFASLGGTGYAASKLAGGAPEHARASKSAKPLTKKQINKLIASYVKKHRATLKGAAGSPGAQGSQGIQGPVGTNGAAGPGATRIVASGSSTTGGEQPVVTVGPWSFTLTCSGSPTNAVVTVHGPGSISSATQLQFQGNPGTTFVSDGAIPIGGGYTFGVNTDARALQTMFLQSGSTLVEAKLHLTATNGGLFEDCELVGDAIPVS
jgi:hypothetical protein